MMQGPIEADAVIVGAGPVGLFQVFELGLLEIRAHVIDTLPYVGGQCIELYPDKPIYDIPAVPRCTGRELVSQLQQQIAPFGATFHLGQQVVAVQRREEDARFLIETDAGRRFLAKTLFIAGGAGSFQPRLLKIDGLEAHRGTQVFYAVDEPNRFAEKDVVVVGGTDTALEWAVKLLREIAPEHSPRRVTLLHRRDAFQASAETLEQIQQLRDAKQLDFVAGQITGIEENDAALSAILVTDTHGVTQPIHLHALLVFMGLSPKLGPIADWQLNLERKQIVVDTEKFETNIPGIFAVGDVNTYPGKKKLILSGFHEATLAAFAAASLVFPDKRVQLQYTTTSSRLHEVLGVVSPAAETHIK